MSIAVFSPLRLGRLRITWAKAIAQHCEEIPNFITERKEELEIIEMLG